MAKNWISARRMRTGRGIGGKASPEVLRAPLREIIRTIRPSRGLFDQAFVELVCGHTTHSNGMYRARCVQCGEKT